MEVVRGSGRRVEVVRGSGRRMEGGSKLEEDGRRDREVEGGGLWVLEGILGGMYVCNMCVCVLPS